jgi:hypothetical protein
MNKKVIISFLLIIKTFLFASGVVASQEEGAKKLTLEQSMQLLEDTKYLLSDKETIDYNDPRLNEILNKYADKYDLFKIYKAFIEFDKSKKTKDDTAKAKRWIFNFCKKRERYCHWSEDYTDEKNALNNFLYFLSVGFEDDLVEVLPGERERNNDKGGYKYIKIPLWLVLKYPDIINGDGVYILMVNARSSIQNLREFYDFMSGFSKIHEGYLTPMFGCQKINSHFYTKNFINIASFNPGYYLDREFRIKTKKSFTENMLYAERESYLSIEHRLKYEKFLKSLHIFSNVLSDYYRENYGLSNYADQADIVISSYVYEHTQQNSDEYDPTIVNFIILFGADKINFLKPVIENLEVVAKSEFLRYAVVANMDFDFIKWLIDNGADVNFDHYKFRSEYPLMASFRNIKTMKLLIDSGADINAKNRIGETALFYAIKFNNIEAVKILINSGANVNAITSPKVRDLNNTDFINSPLIYAKRYASKEIVELLIKHGAKDGPADPAKVEAWIKEGPLDW